MVNVIAQAATVKISGRWAEWQVSLVSPPNNRALEIREPPHPNVFRRGPETGGPISQYVLKGLQGLMPSNIVRRNGLYRDLGNYPKGSEGHQCGTKKGCIVYRTTANHLPIGKHNGQRQ